MTTAERINIRDPFVLVRKDVYYLYGTRGPDCWGPADGFDVYVSRDLISWEGPFECFHNDGTFWADRNYWAPEVHPWRGAYFMFASFKSGDRRRGTCILRSGSPLGPFRPWSDGPVTPAEWECLDGTFYADRNGKPYMVFCHEWVQAGDGEILAMPLSEDLRAPAGAPFLLFRSSEAPWSRPVRHSGGMTGWVTDGPFLWRTEDGVLLCLWSGFSEKGYALGQRGDQRTFRSGRSAVSGGRRTRHDLPRRGRPAVSGAAQSEHASAGAARVPPAGLPAVHARREKALNADPAESRVRFSSPERAPESGPERRAPKVGNGLDLPGEGE